MNQESAIVVYAGKELLDPTGVVVRVSPVVRRKVELLIQESHHLTQISDVSDLNQITEQQGRIVGLMKEIESQQKAAVLPWESVCNTMKGEGKKMSTSLLAEKDRLGGLLDGYAAQEEARRESLIQAQYNQKLQLEQDAERVRAELEGKVEDAKTEKRLAEDLIEMREASKEISRLSEQLKKAELDLEFAKTAEVIPLVFHEPVVPGGMTKRNIDVEIEDIAKIIAHDPTLEYFMSVVRFEINTQECQNRVKAQLKRGIKNPVLPGIKVRIAPRVDIKGSVKITTV